MVEGVISKIRNIVFRNQFDLLVLVIVLLAVMARWVMVFNEEAKAPPIVIDNTVSKDYQDRTLIPSYNPPPSSNTNPDSQSSGSLGETGYALSGLGQPCTTITSNYKSANLPKTDTTQKCDEKKGLECVSGIYEGSICLSYVNQPCELRSDCSPAAPLCINQICQPVGEVINKKCASDIDCKGELGNLNHVCDPVSKLCVFDIWPKDSGCTNSNQCLYSKESPGKISCLTSGDEDGYVLSFGACYFGTSLTVNGSENYKYFTSGNYVAVYEEDPKLYAGRYLIESGTSSPSENKTMVKLNKDFSEIVNPQEGSRYTLDFGSRRDGICVINTPEGAIPEVIPGTTKQRYPCYQGTEVSKDSGGYCLEPGRIDKQGTVENICIYDTDVGCCPGLSCTYDQKTVDSFNGIIGSTYTIVNQEGVKQISGNDVKNIGRCRNQLRELYQTCQNNCIGKYVCLTETDINDKTFSYCGNDWDIMNDRSDLNGCPDGFTLDETSLMCKSSLGKFCFSENDCVSNSKCSNPKRIVLFNPKTQEYSYPSNLNIPTELLPTVSGTIMNLLVSRNYGTDAVSTGFYGFYYKENNVWKIYYQIDGTGFSSDKAITINFESITGEPDFSVIQLEDSVYQINCNYIMEYVNNRRREFQSSSNLYFSGLKNGTSVFFENTLGVYTLDFSGSNISVGSETMNLVNVLDSAGGISPITDFGSNSMTTYDSRYTSNVQSDYFNIQDSFKLLSNGDQFTYVSLPGSSIFFEDNSSVNHNLSETENYYSNIIRYGDNCQILLTEDYNSINSNSYLNQEYLNQSNLRTGVVGGTHDFDGNNSYIQMKKLYGINLLPIRVEKGVDTVQNIGPVLRKDYIDIDSQFTTFNSPLGYMSDTQNIKIDVSEEHMLITYDYEGGLNQTVRLEYKKGTSAGLTNISSNLYYSSSSVTGIETIYYVFKNSFQSPLPSVPYKKSNTLPYQLDQVRSFDQNDINDNTVKFLTTYKNIKPGNPRTAVGNISVFRKILASAGEGDGNISFKYEGIETTADPEPPIYEPGNVFGFPPEISLSPIEESLTADNSTGNIFLEGTDTIIFKNQEDIDVLLKYGSSDLVIGYNNRSNAIIITGINDYDVDLSGNQTLNVKTNIFLDSSSKINNPILYVSNIYPISYDGTSITDGRNLLTSCASKNSLPPSQSNFSFTSTSYNIVYAIMNGLNLPTFLPFYIFQNTGDGFTTGSLPQDTFLKTSSTISEIVSNIENTIYSLDITPQVSNNDSNLFYICNNRFLSILLKSVPVGSTIYLQNISVFNSMSILSEYVNLQGQSVLRESGSIKTKEDTFPFYTGGMKNPGNLDESYLSKLMWPYWIKNLNIETPQIDKVFLNWNPGNMENNMFYYTKVEIAGVKMFLYLSPNFTVNTIKESEPVPVYTDSIDNFSQFFMLPFNKNLAILSGVCDPI